MDSNNATNPLFFFEQLSSSVPHQFKEHINILHTQLIQHLEDLNLSEVEKTKLNTTLSKANETQLTSSLQSFNKHMDLFKVYAIRNLFNEEAQDPQPTTSGSSISLVTENSSKLQVAKAKYLSLRAECSQVLLEKQQTEALLKDMRSTLFALRLAAQSFDGKGVSNVAESVAEVVQYRNNLKSLCSESKAILEQIGSAGGFIAEMELESDHDLSVSRVDEEEQEDREKSQIEAGSMSDISLLNANMYKH